MTSHSVSEATRADFDLLLNSYLEPTFTILQKDKILAPMGMILGASGQPQFIGLAPEDEEDVDAAAHLNAYRKLLKQRLKDGKASLLGYDVKIRDPEYVDAVCVELTSGDGAHIKVIAPYKFTGLRKKLVVGEIQRVE